MQRALLNLRDLASLSERSSLVPEHPADKQITMIRSVSASVAELNTQSILPARSPAPRPPAPPEADVVVLSPPLRSLEDSLPQTALLRNPNSVAELAQATSQQITSSVLGNANHTAALVASLLRG